MIRCYKPKHLKPKENNSLFRLLLPSVLSVCACCICLIGSTLAWFQESMHVGSQKITSAAYEVNATVMLDGEEIPKENGIYLLEAGKTYTVTLTAIGTATTGYCVVRLDETESHTEQFPLPDDTEKKSISFDLVIEEPANAEIIAQWGSSAKPIEEKIKNSDSLTYKDGLIINNTTK